MKLIGWLSRPTVRSLANVLLELFLIIVGVLSAIWVENLRQAAKDKETEFGYLTALQNSLKSDTSMINLEIQRCFQKQHACKLILDMIESGSTVSPEKFQSATEAIMMNIGPSYNTAIFEEMKASGHLQLISNEELRNNLTRYNIKVAYLMSVQDKGVRETSYNPLFTDALTFQEFTFESELDQRIIISRLKSLPDSKLYLQRLQKQVYVFYIALLYSALPQTQTLLDEISQELDKQRHR